jgi:hypothetical protein
MENHLPLTGRITKRKRLGCFDPAEWKKHTDPCSHQQYPAVEPEKRVIAKQRLKTDVEHSQTNTGF